MKKVWAIARQTLQAYFYDRLFHAVSVFAVLLLLFSMLLSSLTFVEQRKILLDFGLAAISLAGVAFAVLLGSTVIRKEIENHTIYTLLAKPLGRTQYVLGKYFGVAMVLALIHFLSVALLGGVIYSLGEPLPAGLSAAGFLMLLEALLVAGVALALSLFFSSSFLSAAMAVAVFLLGRSNYTFFTLSDRAQDPALKFLLRAAHDYLPSLQRFDIRDLVAYGKPYPNGMVGVSSTYFIAYLAFVLAVAVLLMRRKDLK